MEIILAILIVAIGFVVLVAVAWGLAELFYRIGNIYHKNIEKQYPKVIDNYSRFAEIHEEYLKIVVSPMLDITYEIHKKRDLIPRATIQEKKDLSAEIEILKKEESKIENEHEDLIEKKNLALIDLRKSIDNISNKKHQKYFHDYGYYQRFLQ